jgi:hypothetical protein
METNSDEAMGIQGDCRVIPIVSTRKAPSSEPEMPTIPVIRRLISSSPGFKARAKNPTDKPMTMNPMKDILFPSARFSNYFYHRSSYTALFVALIKSRFLAGMEWSNPRLREGSGF